MCPSVKRTHKFHFDVVLKRILNEFLRSDASSQQADSFTLLQEMVNSVKQGLQDFSKPETVNGAIHLSESIFSCCTTPERFRKAYESLAPALTENVQKCFDMFRASAEVFKQQGAESPAAAEITQQLKLITNWVSMHN